MPCARDADEAGHNAVPGPPRRCGVSLTAAAPRCAGARRFRVEFRVGGRESATRYGGSFKTKREADERKKWIAGQLAARIVPDLRSLETAARTRTVGQACAAWRATRIDVTESTRVLHRVALGRVVPLLGDRRIDELTIDDVNAMTVALADAGKKRETIRKSVKYLAAVLEGTKVLTRTRRAASASASRTRSTRGSTRRPLRTSRPSTGC
jgi:hypothetical protein